MSAYEFQGWYRVGDSGSARVPRVLPEGLARVTWL